MQLREALRTTGAVREFDGTPVDRATVYDLLETARFAPSGGNRQGWRVVLVEDPTKKLRPARLYLPGWYEYLAIARAGLTPFAPATDRVAEAAALLDAPAIAAAAADADGGFAERLDEVPVLLVLLADLRRLAAIDRDENGYTFIGGASIYPFAWSILLAAHDVGLGGVMTTMVRRQEREVRALLGADEHLAVAGLLALGRPVTRATKLRRGEVASFATATASTASRCRASRPQSSSAARSAGNAEVTRTRSPVRGWSNPSSAACRKTRPSWSRCHGVGRSGGRSRSAGRWPRGARGSGGCALTRGAARGASSWVTGTVARPGSRCGPDGRLRARPSWSACAVNGRSARR